MYLYIFYKKYINYLQLIGYNKHIFLYIKKSKLLKKININNIVIKLKTLKYLNKFKKIRRIKKRIKKRLYNFENKNF